VTESVYERPSPVIASFQDGKSRRVAIMAQW
jgi:hypothetical protein